MEQKSNVQLNSKCKIIDISQKMSTKLFYKCPVLPIRGAPWTGILLHTS